jgi:hypothetical protein
MEQIMALQTRNWAPVGGVAAAFPNVGPALPALPVNAADDVSNVIGQLNVGHFFGALGNTGVDDAQRGWRIDRQNAPAGFVNLSVQRNGVGSPSTVASVFVPVSLNIAPGAGGPMAQPFAARISELERAVRRGLEESFQTWNAVPGPGGAAAAQITRREVAGTFSA